ncbi:MAG: hypothetical protein H7X80_08385 [bacterium]|nr:hypothetical protein [Candidatus Kapabacteria bacterium]
MATPAVPTGVGRFFNIFMIVAFVVGIFYLVSFVRMYPQYWFAAALFLIIAVVGIVKRIAILRGRLPEHRAPVRENGSSEVN